MTHERELPELEVDVEAMIPVDLAEKLKDLATSLNCSQADLLREAIGACIGQPTIFDRIAVLEKKLDRFLDDGTVVPVISLDLTTKIEQLIEINMTLINQNIELKKTIANLNEQVIASLHREKNNLTQKLNNIKQQPLN